MRNIFVGVRYRGHHAGRRSLIRTLNLHSCVALPPKASYTMRNSELRPRRFRRLVF
jgi:hypothetical protein